MGLLVVGARIRLAVSEDAASPERGGDVGSVSLLRAVEGVVVGLRLVLAVVVVTDEIDATLDVRRIGSIPSWVGFVLSVCCRLLLVGVRSAGAAKGRVGVVDATVDDGDLDALSGVASGSAGSLPYLRDAEGGHTGSVAALVHGDGVHGLHPGHGPKRFQLVVVDGHAHPIEGGLHLPLDLSTLGLNGLGNLSLVTLQFAFYVLLLGLAERSLGLCLRHGDGVTLEFHHDGALALGLEELLCSVRTDLPIRSRNGKTAYAALASRLVRGGH